MFEFLAGMFTTYILTWPALLFFCVVGIYLEHEEAQGWAVFIGMVTAVISYYFFKVNLADILTYSALYFVIGFLWSFWRYKRYVETKVAYKYKVDLTPDKCVDKITMWVIVWPFSFVENFIGDVIETIQIFITKFFKGIYNKIYESITKDLQS